MFKTDSGTLAAALQTVLPACERRRTIPILATVRLRAAGGRLTVSASNLDMQMDAIALVDGADGALCVDPRPLLALLRGLGKREAISLAQDAASRAVVTWNGGRVAFPTLPAGDFPEMEFKAALMAEPDGTVLDALKRAQPFISTEETRYYLNGVCLDGRAAGGVNIAGSNGSMLFATPAGPSLAALDGRAVIVPRDAVRQWIALASKGPVILRASSGAKLEIEGADARLTAKLIDGDFPQWRRAVPDLAGYARVPLPRAAFMRALGLVLGSLPSREASAVLALADGRLSLEAHDPDFGDIAIDLGPAHGPAFEAGFNQRLLRQCASATRGELSVWVPNRGGATVEPVVFGGSESPEGELVVLMPTRSFSRAKLSAPALAEAA